MSFGGWWLISGFAYNSELRMVTDLTFGDLKNLCRKAYDSGLQAGSKKDSVDKKISKAGLPRRLKRQKRKGRGG